MAKQSRSVKKSVNNMCKYWPVAFIFMLGLSLSVAKYYSYTQTVNPDKPKHVCNEQQLEHAYTMGYQAGH